MEEKTDELGRRVWDTTHYEELARKRAYELDEVLDGKRPRKSAAVERRPLEQRKDELRLDANLGKRIVVTSFTPKSQQGGFWCDTCQCLLKDSKAWLDHINGKRHNRMLGMTMQVAKSSVEDVKLKLGALVTQREKTEIPTAPLTVAERLALKEKEKKEEKRLKKKLKKQKKTEESQTDDEEQRQLSEFLAM